MSTKSKKTDKTMTGKTLRASVGKALTKAKATVTKAKAKPKATPVVEVVDVTKEVMGALEQQAKAKRLSTKEAKAVKQAHGKEFAEALEKTAATVVEATQGEEAKAADAVYAYADSLGIDIGDVVRISKSCGEYAVLVEKAGMEITDRVVWLAGQKAREFDAKHVRPHSPTSGLGKSATAKRGAAKGNSGDGSAKARVTVFGHAATAVIRALRASCGMGFAQIRNVLDAMGADSVADATIRCQMAGEGRKRGEPATLTTEQIEKAKAACVAVAV
jgi:hypothetical protein